MKRRIKTISIVRFSVDPQNSEILVGTNRIDRKSGGKRYKVKRAFVHKDYGRKNMGWHIGDIALAQIKNFIEFNRKVQPIKCLRKEVPKGAALQVFGWKRLSVSFMVFD